MGISRFTILFVFVSAVAMPIPQPASHSHAPASAGGPGWGAFAESMGKMHSAMAATEPTGNCDADFVRLMLPHHQGAMDMAKAELVYGKDPQMRRLAQEVITDQQSEIELMQLWLKRRGPEALKIQTGPAF